MYFSLYEGQIIQRDGGVIDEHMAWALCLGCIWLQPLGSTRNHPDWAAKGEAAVRAHEADPSNA